MVRHERAPEQFMCAVRHERAPEQQFREERAMGQVNGNGAVDAYMADYQYRTNEAQSSKTDKTPSQVKKHRVYGRTIGSPALSEKAQKYYEKLKEKYKNMDFILVSPDKKEEAERNKGMYGSTKELLVLIDSDKIEKMASDESYRKKYEAILSGATSQLEQMKSELGSSAEKVSSFGMTFDDHGNASFFAVIDKSLARQRERIEEKRAEAREDRKEAAADAVKKRIEENHSKEDDRVTVTASSWDELLKKIGEVIAKERTNAVISDGERRVGQSFDFSI